MTKNKLYVYTFIFFFMLCIGLIAGSYTVNINKKHWFDTQSEMNPHAQTNAVDEQTEKNKNQIILQMLFDVYVTVNASVDTERAYADAITALQNASDQSATEQAQVIKDINTSLQAVIQAYSPKLVGIQKNLNSTLQTMIKGNLIPDVDKEQLSTSLRYLNKHMNTLAEMGHLIVRNENPFTTEAIEQISKSLNAMIEERTTIQRNLEERISTRMSIKDNEEVMEIQPKDDAIF